MIFRKALCKTCMSHSYMTAVFWHVHKYSPPLTSACTEVMKTKEQRSSEVFWVSLNCTCLMMYIFVFFIESTQEEKWRPAFRAQAREPVNDQNTLKAMSPACTWPYLSRWCWDAKWTHRLGVLHCIFPQCDTPLCSGLVYIRCSSTKLDASSSLCHLEWQSIVRDQTLDQIALRCTGVAILEILLFASINK